MEIPKEAKLVFKGILFDVYQWRQRVFDGSYETFEMLKRKATVDIIAIVDHKIMVIMQKQPRRATYPSLAGGRIEKNETPIAAAKRELLEETGYASPRLQILDEFFGSSKIFFHECLIVARKCKKVANPACDPGEETEVKLVQFEEFLQLCRNKKFIAPQELKFMMYEALLDNTKKGQLRRKIYGK